MSQLITFEQPLNERLRNLLRLEFLFRQAEHFLAGSSPWDSRLVIASFQDILALLSRADVKTELIRELERNANSLASHLTKPQVDQQQLGKVLAELEQLRTLFHGIKGQPGQELRDNELLNAVRQRNSFSSGPCDFDLPVYHHWLHRPPTERQSELRSWLDCFASLKQAVALLLRLTRASTEATDEIAENGFFHRTLDPALPYQLLRVALPEGTPYFTEISGGKHRFTVRFLEPAASGRAQQTCENVSFQLTCCVL